MLRIDHVMGLHRLYWIPPGFPASQGAYVSYPAEELHAILSLESHRHQTIMVGEDLGTVPAEVHQAMDRHGLRHTYVLQYEQGSNPKHALRIPPRKSVASLNTHDMPPFAAHWRGLDIQDRHDLGLIPKRKLPLEHKRRQQINRALAIFLCREGWLDCDDIKPLEPEQVLKACLAWLSASPAETVLVNLEDLWLETRSQNTPGTWRERPNWRRKAKFTVEEIIGCKKFRELLGEINRLRQHAGSRPGPILKRQPKQLWSAAASGARRRFSLVSDQRLHPKAAPRSEE
jgi:4-alpha-glucanotransferase